MDALAGMGRGRPGAIPPAACRPIRHPKGGLTPHPTVIAGLVPAIHASACAKPSMDHRDKPGDDEGEGLAASHPTMSFRRRPESISASRPAHGLAVCPYRLRPNSRSMSFFFSST